MKRLHLLAFIMLNNCFAAFGQTGDFVKSEGITSPLHQDNIGKIAFMGPVIPIEQYKSSDFLTQFELKENVDFNIRVFMGNSLTNYLHILAPELPAEVLTNKGNHQFAFYVDGTLIYTENLNVGAGGAEWKNTRTVFRAPLLSTTNEDAWGRFLWNRFMLRGGEDALSEGRHLLKIEIRPYLDHNGLKIGELIASGQITVEVPATPIPEKLVAIQPIKSKSGWPISSDKYNADLIRELNRRIVSRRFKDITSIVVIKDGKLILEEYFNGAKRGSLADTRSVGKSFTAAITGIAIQDGYLKDETQLLREFYDLKQFDNYGSKKDSITIYSLLTMSSGFDGSDMDEKSPGNEERMYPTSDWVRFALNLPMNPNKTIGRDWDYFTAGVVLLGDILNKSVPNGLEEYAHHQLFKPLGIKKYKWQYTPQKLANTAGGLQLQALDLAKFGQLFKNGGEWDGQQVLTKAWVEKCLEKHIQLTGMEEEYYGLLFWNKTYHVGDASHEVAYCSGNGGNKVFIFKDRPLVVVITATAYNKPYGHAQVDRMIQDYIIPAFLGE